VTEPADSPKAMWEAFLASTHDPPTAPSYTAWHFCDTQELADALAELVRAGRKRATTAALWTHEPIGEPLPRPGDLSVVTDWSGRARCIIRTTSVEIVAFSEVDDEFARAEGEGDGSLAYWRQAHWAYFTRELASLGRLPADDMPVVCERFEVVYGASQGSAAPLVTPDEPD
jgi:uncharacterized protein YhfF